MLQQFANNWDFKVRARKEKAIPQAVFVEKEVSFIKYTYLHKREGSDYFSKKVRTP